MGHLMAVSLVPKEVILLVLQETVAVVVQFQGSTFHGHVHLPTVGGVEGQVEAHPTQEPTQYRIGIRVPMTSD
jgi:hypothetical protein